PRDLLPSPTRRSSDLAHGAHTACLAAANANGGAILHNHNGIRFYMFAHGHGKAHISQLLYVWLMLSNGVQLCLFKACGIFVLQRSEEHTSELQSRENL